MRKNAFLVAMIFSILSSFILTQPRSGYCDSETAVESAGTAKQQLVSLDKSQSEDRLRELDRRVDDLEREKRFQDERIRNLERTVNDLRRER